MIGEGDPFYLKSNRLFALNNKNNDNNNNNSDYGSTDLLRKLHRDT